MRIGSLFSGIGGLELGLERAGLGRTVWQVERSAFCRWVLRSHWPGAVQHDDVRTVGRANLAPVDLICGGFPCQDLSSAGKGAGLAGARSGLWYHMERVINEIEPGWVVVENVASGWRRWLPVVRRRLWALGYAALPLRLRASDVGARHQRARVFVVASTDHARLRLAQRAHLRGDGATQQPAPPRGGGNADFADIVCKGLRREQQPEDGNPRPDGPPVVRPGFGWPAFSPLVRRVYGFPAGLDVPRWRGAGWSPARLRRARIHALGNAVVPQCAEAVGRLIFNATAGGRDGCT